MILRFQPLIHKWFAFDLVFISHYFRSHMSFKRIFCFIRLLTLRMAVPLYCENSFRRCHTITNSFLYIRNNRSFFLPECTKSAFIRLHTIMVVPSLYGRITTFLPWIYSKSIGACAKASNCFCEIYQISSDTQRTVLFQHRHHVRSDNVLIVANMDIK